MDQDTLADVECGLEVVGLVKRAFLRVELLGDTLAPLVTQAAEQVRLCRRQLLEARETIARLNRRCQSAESGLLAKSTSVRFKSAVENALRSRLDDRDRKIRQLQELLVSVTPSEYEPVDPTMADVLREARVQCPFS